MLQDLNEVGGLLAQAKPIASAHLLLTHSLALITSNRSDVYSEEAVKQAESIQVQLAKDTHTIYFTLRQLDDEVA